MLQIRRLAPLLLLLALSASASAQEGGAKPKSEALFQELHGKLAKQGAFQVRVRYESKAYKAEGSLELFYQPEQSRLLVKRVEVRPEPGKSFALFESGRATYWSGAQGQALEADLSTAIEVFAPLTQLLGRVGGVDAAPLSELLPELQLGLSPTKAGRPTLDLGLGVSLIRGSWLRWLRSLPEGAELAAQEDAVVLKLPEPKLRVVYDRATGFFESQTLTLAEGTFWLRADELRPLKAFPEVRPPEGIPSEVLPMPRFVALMEQLSTEVMRVAPAKIDDPDKLRQAYTAAVAGASHARRNHYLSASARYFVARRREQGRSPAQLREDFDAELVTFTKAAQPVLEDLEAQEQRQIAGLRDRLLAEIAKDAPHRALLAEGLSPERVAAALPADRPLKEHLQAALKAAR